MTKSVVTRVCIDTTIAFVISLIFWWKDFRIEKSLIYVFSRIVFIQLNLKCTKYTKTKVMSNCLWTSVDIFAEGAKTLLKASLILIWRISLKSWFSNRAIIRFSPPADPHVHAIATNVMCNYEFFYFKCETNFYLKCTYLFPS